MQLPVLPLRAIARAARIREDRVLAICAANRIPTITYEGNRVVIDAEAFEWLARRELGDDAVDSIRAARGGPLRHPVSPAELVGAADASSHHAFNADNMEEVLRAALKAHGGVLSRPLFAAWCRREGIPVPDIGTVARRMGVATWTDALEACDGRRGVTTPEKRARALRTLRRALDAHSGTMRMEDLRLWAIESGAEWRDPQRLARAAGFERWSEAVKAARQLPPE